MRIMAIDYGDARTGVAISDPTGLLAGHTEVIHSRKPEAVADRLAALVREHGEAACGLRPVLWDERRTTVEAHGILHASGKRMKNHRKTVDAVAAALILEGYLARRRQAP